MPRYDEDEEIRLYINRMIKGESTGVGRGAKPCVELHLIDSIRTIQTVQYADIDSAGCCIYLPTEDEIAVGQEDYFKVQFAGVELVRIEVRGRNLLPVYYYIAARKMPWIGQPVNPKVEANEAVITSLTWRYVSEAELAWEKHKANLEWEEAHPQETAEMRAAMGQ